ncbi:rhomboid family intramembrane serine protease [Bacteroides sp. OttesenSCG-928-E20]|nr:rhomboid family intramembrane serine protease [Bacteroides sp. OttesenSCG-928-E20]
MKNEVRKILVATVIPLFLIFIMYAIKILEVGMNWNLGWLGIYPLTKKGIFGILSHPFIHGSFDHLFANTLPFFFLGWCFFYFYRQIAPYIFVLLWLLSGLFTFVIGKPGWHIGASGVIYALAFFLFFSGILRKHIPLIAISLLVTFLYGSLVWNMFPFFAKPTTSWEGHLSGALAGIICAFIFKEYGPQKPDPFIEEEEEEEEEVVEGEKPEDDAEEQDTNLSC